jgi:hypothetical protein
MVVMAEAYARVGEAERAVQMAEKGIARARQTSNGLLSWMLMLLARVLLRTKGLVSLEAIEEALEEAFRLAHIAAFKELEPLICVERAEIAQLTGDEATRERELREAHRLFTEIGAPIRAAEVAKELGLATGS